MRRHRSTSGRSPRVIARTVSRSSWSTTNSLTSPDRSRGAGSACTLAQVRRAAAAQDSPGADDAGQVATAVVDDDVGPASLPAGHRPGLARCTSGGAADHGKSIHASVCRQTYSGRITVHGFS